MKTTIEIHGYEILIEESGESIKVSALKEGEAVEEFELEIGEGNENEEMPTDEEDGIKSFDQFGGEEEDFGDEEEGDDEDGDEEFDSEHDEEPKEEEEDVDDEEGHLESFQHFINKRK